MAEMWGILKEFEFSIFKGFSKVYVEVDSIMAIVLRYIHVFPWFPRFRVRMTSCRFSSNLLIK